LVVGLVVGVGLVESLVGFRVGFKFFTFARNVGVNDGLLEGNTEGVVGFRVGQCDGLRFALSCLFVFISGREAILIAEDDLKNFGAAYNIVF
jgi:hypothetical protein